MTDLESQQTPDPTSAGASAVVVRDKPALEGLEAKWAERWAQRSKARGKPNQVFGWSGGDAGSTLTPPAHQKLAGPWTNGKDPAV